MTWARVGDIEITPFFDGRRTSPISRTFGDLDESFARAQFERHPSAFGSTPQEWHNSFGFFAVRAGRRVILIDLGLGPASSIPGVTPAGEGFDAQLAAAGIAADEVNTVFFTHLHTDHIGWALDDEGRQPRFGNAAYVVHERDWHHFVPADEGVVGRVTPLREAGILRLISDATQELAAGVTAVATPGHTPGHMSVHLESDGHHGFVSGDLIHHPMQVEQPSICPRVDIDGEQAQEHRQRWLATVASSGGLWASGHFPPPSVGRLSYRGAHIEWTPEFV